MCGICGVIGPGTGGPGERRVARMLEALEHRGPDDEGVVSAPGVVLGMRRLSIIDVPGGHQPIASEDGGVVVIYNGEIYNHRPLRAELEALGHRFRTRADTEVLVHGYEAWGDDLPRRLRGMFAFAVLDRRHAGRERVLLARDRFGIKPLYLADSADGLTFASEVRALLAAGAAPPRIDPAGLASYLLFGSVAEPETLVAGVRSLPPGHRLAVERVGGAGEPTPYYDLAEATLGVGAGSGDGAGGDVVARTRAMLEESVRLHLIADVPVGVFLSSGIDSTAVAALAAREVGGLHTLTVAFPDRDYSEAAMARRTAERLGTRHDELVLDGAALLSRIDEAVGALDLPSMDGVNTYFVSWAAAQAGLKVALSGLGSDEVFGGYRTFRDAGRLRRLAAIAERVPASLRRATSPALRAVGSASGGAKLEDLWRQPDALPHPYFWLRSLFSPGQAGTLLADPRQAPGDWRRRMDDDAARVAGASDFAAATYLELRWYMLNTLLRDTDAASMASSLEVRVPFLDHPLVEHVLAAPLAARRAGGRPKALLVDALADLLPAEVVEQRKRTFTFPWEPWLRGPLRDVVGDRLERLAPSLLEHLRPGAGRDVFRAFLDGRTSWSRVWSLYTLNEWAQAHLDAPSLADERGGASARAAVAG